MLIFPDRKRSKTSTYRLNSTLRQWVIRLPKTLVYQEMSPIYFEKTH